MLDYLVIELFNSLETAQQTKSFETYRDWSDRARLLSRALQDLFADCFRTDTLDLCANKPADSCSQTEKDIWTITCNRITLLRDVKIPKLELCLLTVQKLVISHNNWKLDITPLLAFVLKMDPRRRDLNLESEEEAKTLNKATFRSIQTAEELLKGWSGLYEKNMEIYTNPLSRANSSGNNMNRANSFQSDFQPPHRVNSGSGGSSDGETRFRMLEKRFGEMLEW